MRIKCYHPFTPVSVTGPECELSCAHCGGHYLEHMIDVRGPSQLISAGGRIRGKGQGILLSGGFTAEGVLPLSPFLRAAAELRATGCLINAHVGLVSSETEAIKIKGAVDFVSAEIVGSVRTIREVFGLRATPRDYIETIKRLQGVGIRVVPHITAGIQYGKLLGERSAIRALGELKPQVLVFNVLRPTPGTRMGKVRPPPPEVVGELIELARRLLPQTELALGCMRPAHGRRELEALALRKGVSRFALPLRETTELARSMGYTVEEVEACCALPTEFEDRLNRVV